MGTKRGSFVSVLVMLAVAGCHRDSLAPPWLILLSPNVDTLNAQITPGVTLSLVGLKDTYTLDDTITASLVLRNYSDSSPFILWTGNSPPNRVLVSLLDSPDIIYYYPSVIEFAEFRDTLRRGDSLSIRIIWDGHTWDARESRWTDLKAYSGTYQLETRLGGNMLLNHPLTKIITISERGYPFSGDLRVDYSSTDSVKADFIIRNRKSGALPLDPVDTTPISLAFLAGKDTIVVLKYQLASSAFKLQGFADTVILPFRAAKGDSRFAKLKGAFDMRAILRLNSRLISASGFRYLP
jgi:hypothetical protein